MSDKDKKGKRSSNKELVADLGVNAWQDWALGEGLDRVTEKLAIPLERMAGGVLGGSGGAVAGRLASAPAAAAVEIGRGAYLMSDPKNREGHAEGGRQLMEEPKWYRDGNMALNPAEAMSKYGGMMEEDDKKAFDQANRQRPMDDRNNKNQEKYAKESLAKMDEEKANKLIDDIAYDRTLREKNEMTRAVAKETGKPMGALYGAEREAEYNRKQLAEREKIEDEEITMNMVRSYFSNRA